MEVSFSETFKKTFQRIKGTNSEITFRGTGAIGFVGKMNIATERPVRT